MRISRYQNLQSDQLTETKRQKKRSKLQSAGKISKRPSRFDYPHDAAPSTNRVDSPKRNQSTNHNFILPSTARSRESFSQLHPEQPYASKHTLYSQSIQDDKLSEFSEAYHKDNSEDFGDILASFSLWLLHSLRLEGLLFAIQLAAFSLIVQHYLPPLSRRYFDHSATALLLPAEDSLDQLLNEDILLSSPSPREGRSSEIHIASIRVRGQKLSPKQLQSIIHPAYRTRKYTVNSGDNISWLAQHYRLNMSTLISVNHIERAKSLKAGETLLIPNIDGLIYEIQPKDSLSSIAHKFDSSIGALIDTNQLESEQLFTGSQIFIPGATLSPYELRKVFGKLYIYPHIGRLSSQFSYRQDPFRRGVREFHNGLDIVGPRGAAVQASSDGKVVSAGYHSIYGHYIILQHAKGIKTLYGHMSRLLASKGQQIIQGQSIGLIGTSGRSTGPHLHFTIFIAGKAVNPLDYLSKP